MGTQDKLRKRCLVSLGDKASDIDIYKKKITAGIASSLAKTCCKYTSSAKELALKVGIQDFQVAYLMLFPSKPREKRLHHDNIFQDACKVIGSCKTFVNELRTKQSYKKRKVIIA